MVTHTVIQPTRSPHVDDTALPTVFPDGWARLLMETLYHNKYSIIIVSWYVTRSPLAKVNSNLTEAKPSSLAKTKNSCKIIDVNAKDEYFLHFHIFRDIRWCLLQQVLSNCFDDVCWEWTFWYLPFLNPLRRWRRRERQVLRPPFPFYDTSWCLL